MEGINVYIKRIVLFGAIIFLAGNAYSYHKFRHPVQKSVVHAPFNLSQSSYTLVDTTGTVASYVQLTASDKKRIKKVLNRFAVSTNVTPDFIKQFVSSSRSRKNIVGLVLQDFTLIKNDTTIGAILASLNLSGK